MTKFKEHSKERLAIFKCNDAVSHHLKTFIACIEEELLYQPCIPPRKKNKTKKEKQKLTLIESLRTTQIAFFRFATLCGFFRGSADEVQKLLVQGSCKRKSYETICENIVSRYQTLVSSLPRGTVFLRCTDDRKPNL